MDQSAESLYADGRFPGIYPERGKPTRAFWHPNFTP
jgi:hypothetical protein